ncbi:aldose 1-epimerase family protein [Perilla frutescens var. hirtella]|uniref:glucose-6-phosphate 1-epimerase n=1 Tax=Perilla frutescens var. hirtella TaxID=608512 RepID=A0AAD4J189_PERFH|nr:aldose 1-epimerase family protein [Perilla frutescens var. hirtella]
MQHDEVIWQVIRHKHCSFMAKIETGIFCRNPYNVTGICNRSSCPLANSRYATIRDHDGVFYLYMKTIERAHMPNKLWERVKLPRNYEKALEIIDKHLIYWPKLLVHKTKQRMTKMTQMRIRMRKLALKTREKIMTVPTKQKKREARREEKAEKAAVLEKSIEKELLERLKKGVYGDIYNYPVDKYNEILDKEEHEIEYVEGYEDLEEEDDMEDFGGLAIREDYDNGKTVLIYCFIVLQTDNITTPLLRFKLGETLRGRKNSARKLEKEESAAKSKKKGKVHVELEQRKGVGDKDNEVVKRIIRRWRLFRSLKQMPFSVVNDSNGVQRVRLSHQPGGSSVEVVLQGGRIVSWKNDRGEELLFVRNKITGRSPTAILGGISICFPQISSLGQFEQYEYIKNRLWSLDYSPDLDQDTNGSQSSVNLLLESSDKDSKLWPCRFELRLKISISPGKLTLSPSVRNVGDKPFSFTFAMRNHLSVSDISEVRVEGLETLDFLDNLLHKKRFTEQADALTFDGEVNRVYFNTPSKIAVIDHGKKRTFVLHKQGLPDSVVWNPWDKPSRNVLNLGDDYKTMLSVDSAVFEKPIVLKPCQVWRAFQGINAVSSSYCSGQLDPTKVVQGAG